MATESINRTELAAFRAYVETHRADMLELVLRGAPSIQHFTRVPGVAGELVMEWSDIQDVVGPWAADFNSGANKFTRKPVRVRSYFQKAEARFSPKSDFATYRGFLVNTKMSAIDYPYARWAMEKMARKIKTQLEFDQIFTGDYSPTPTTASEMFNGLLTILADDQAAGTPVLTPVTTGVLSAANIIDQVEQMEDAINEEYRTQDMYMYVAPEIFKMYRRAYRAASGFDPMNKDTDTPDMIKLDGTNTQLISCPGMTGSQRIILTPKGNVYYAYDDPTDDAVFEMEQDHRYLDVWCDFWGGVGFFILDPRIVYINDQA